MSDEYDNNGSGFFRGVADFFGMSLGIAKVVTFFTILVTCTCTPAYFAWTTRGDLEKQAREGVIVTPLEYRETFMEFPSLGYKIVIENITDNDTDMTLADIVYKQGMLEQQRMAISNAIYLKSEAIKKQKEAQEAIHELERVQKQEKLAKDVGDALEISDEDKEGLVNILTGG